ncbi:MAG: DUF4197 domain-containing protein [Desulfobacteraceae bacterium]|nr:DUF4197 domain-containing protein [Desulfobacteraceae bacterium]
MTCIFISSPVNAENFFEKGLKFFSGSGENESQAGPTANEVSKAFKQALRLGAEDVVAQLGQKDGFNADPNVHIPLPEKFEVVKTTLDKSGLSFLTDDLELKLNRAAEKATPEAKALFVEAIRNMTFEDVMQIYKGPEDSATKYFQGRMSAPLSEKMQPIVENSLSRVGAIQSYDRVMDKYQSMPFVPDIKANLTTYVTQKGMEGIFYYMAEEEAAIRQDPAKQTTELLKRVFGSQ